MTQARMNPPAPNASPRATHCSANILSARRPKEKRDSSLDSIAPLAPHAAVGRLKFANNRVLVHQC